MTPTAKENEVEVLLSDLAAGAVYRVYLHISDSQPTAEFEAMLGGIFRKDGLSKLAFDGVDIETRTGVGLKFFRKVW